jgi:hypothetical protein
MGTPHGALMKVVSLDKALKLWVACVGGATLYYRLHP